MIEKYVVSLDLAKKLKEAGWEKETVYWWVKTQRGIRLEAIRYVELYPKQSYGIIWLDDAGKEEFMPLAPAPLAEEILEELPKYIYEHVEGERKTYYLTVKIDKNGYSIGYSDELTEWLYLFTLFDQLSNAAAQVWLWLKEHGYLEEEDEQV